MSLMLAKWKQASESGITCLILLVAFKNTRGQHPPLRLGRDLLFTRKAAGGLRSPHGSASALAWPLLPPAPAGSHPPARLIPVMWPAGSVAPSYQQKAPGALWGRSLSSLPAPAPSGQETREGVLPWS